MHDSDDEDQYNLPPPPKRRKFVYKKLGERIAQVSTFYCNYVMLHLAILDQITGPCIL